MELSEEQTLRILRILVEVLESPEVGLFLIRSFATKLSESKPKFS